MSNSKLQDNGLRHHDVLVFFYSLTSDGPEDPSHYSTNSKRQDNMGSIYRISREDAFSFSEMLEINQTERVLDPTVLDRTVLADPAMAALSCHVDSLICVRSNGPSPASSRFASPERSGDHVDHDGARQAILALERQLLKQLALLQAANTRRKAAMERVRELEEELAEARALVDWYLSKLRCVRLLRSSPDQPTLTTFSLKRIQDENPSSIQPPSSILPPCSIPSHSRVLPVSYLLVSTLLLVPACRPSPASLCPLF
jgi:hypothetical protein